MTSVHGEVGRSPVGGSRVESLADHDQMVDETSREAPIEPRGLGFQKSNNSCYANSLFQILLHWPKFNRWIADAVGPHSTYYQQTIGTEFMRLVHQSQHKVYPSMNSLGFRKEMRELERLKAAEDGWEVPSTDFSKDEQQDPAEFMMAIRTLVEDLPFPNDSLISWKGSNGVEELHNELIVHVKDGDTQVLEDLINEVLIGKVVLILPDVLQVTISSSVYDLHSDSFSMGKPKVDVPLTNFCIKNVCYDLFGVIDHQGQSIEGGHYVAKVLEGNHWIQWDDDVATIDPVVVTPDATMLFYKVITLH